MRLHHVGVVVKDLESYGREYAGQLGLVADSEVIHDPIQKVRAQFWRDGHGGLVELVEAAGPDSPAWRESQKGRGLNHLCFETEDIEQAVQSAIQHGSMLMGEIVPGVAFSGRRIAFLYSLELGLIELLETQ